jgi:deoxynucleoside triphosphate triphosphohydrolase SAMHD1
MSISMRLYSFFVAQELEEARAIFRRLAVRDLYRLVDTTLIDYDARQTLAVAVTPEAIVAAVKQRFASATDANELPHLAPDVDPALVAALEPAHIIVDVTVMHYGMKNVNPLATVHFYSKTHPNKAVAVDKAHFSTSLPARFAEANLRVYTRDARFFGLIQAGYRAVLARVPGFAPEGTDEVPEGAYTPTVDDDATTTVGSRATPRTASLASLPSFGVGPAVPGTPPARPGALPVHTPGGSHGGETPKIMVNPLTTVPANYTPASPPRWPSGGTKRVRSPSNSSMREAKRRG